MPVDWARAPKQQRTSPHPLHAHMQVSWHGVQHPSYADWIGLLVPAGANPTKSAPAKYQIASADLDGTHLQTGAGRLRFRVINHRTAVQFAFFRGGLMQPVLAARSPPIQPSNPNEPLQRRLALTGDSRCACRNRVLACEAWRDLFHTLESALLVASLSESGSAAAMVRIKEGACCSSAVLPLSV